MRMYPASVSGSSIAKDRTTDLMAVVEERFERMDHQTI